MADKIEQPGLQWQQALDAIISDTGTDVEIPGTKKKVHISWMRNGTMRKLSHMLATDPDNDKSWKLNTKIAAVVILNSWWKVKFLYWILWRWMYYVKEYTQAQLLPIVMEGKKKVPSDAYFVNTTLLTAMRDTMMTMTREGANRGQAARAGEQPSASAKSGPGSSPESTE